MSDSVHPLSPAEWTTLVDFAPSYLKPWLAYQDFDPVRVALWIARTGMHPCVLAYPQRHNLTVYETPRGLTASWDRPKKHKSATTSHTEVPLKDPLVTGWAREFVESIRAHPVPLSTIARAVRDVGRQAGIYLGPRCLRHTFLRYVADRTRDPTAVKALGNVSGPVAMAYTQRARVEEYRDAL